MKKIYIKPTLTSVISLTENNLLDSASRTSIEGEEQWIGKNDSPEGSEAADAAAKGYNAWASWDE